MEDEPVEDGGRHYVGWDDGRPSDALSALERKWYGEIERRPIASWEEDGVKRYRLTDKRGQHVVRACLLCKQVRPLRLGHVHPKWTGRAIRDEGGFEYEFKDATGVHLHVEQDFPKHYLLCGECEQRISASERYVSLLSRGQPADLARINVMRRNDNLVTGLDRNLLLRFAASFWLRSHAAVSTGFRLSHRIETELRTAIQQDHYPESRHQLSIAKTFTRAGSYGANARAVTIRYAADLPVLRLEAVLGGLYFVYFVRDYDKRTHWDDDESRQIHEPVSVRGSALWFLPIEVFDLNIFKLHHGRPVDIEYPLPPIDLDGPCVCGWGVGTLRDCCGSTWLEAFVREGPFELDDLDPGATRH